MRHGWDAQHAISDPYVLCMHTFVDDPIHITRGDDDTKVLALPRALLWAVRAGFPLAWHKSDGGKNAVRPLQPRWWSLPQ